MNSEGYYNYIFTSHGGDDSPGGFWPFVTIYNSAGQNTWANQKWQSMFHGIFNYYTIGAYIFYIVLGFAIVFIPKLWNRPITK